MTTTSLLPHKPPPLQSRNTVFLRSNYYGSVGRPCNARRKSAVELLEESKSNYVKSESVLDTTQKLNSRSPPTVEVVTTLPRGSHHCIASFAICPGCSPYSYTAAQEQIKLKALQEHYAATYSRLQREAAEVIYNSTAGFYSNSFISVPRRASIPTHSQQPPHKFQMPREVFLGAPPTTPNPTIISFPELPFSPPAPARPPTRGGATVVTASNPPPVPPPAKSSDNKHSVPIPIIATVSTLPSALPSPLSTIPNLGTRSRDVSDSSSPPPLPPKSPRTTVKPTRPHDFPQRLRGVRAAPPDIHPPPPPRRLSDHNQDVQSKLRRLIHEHPPPVGISDLLTKSCSILDPTSSATLPITLPSPILPPTPPPDITMESPMSDSGPIISPPPAFSTPVTPMLDRHPSSASEMSGHLSRGLTARSVVSASSGRKSEFGNCSDVSMRQSPRSPESSSSPTSPDLTNGEDDGDANGYADDDSSGRSPPPRMVVSKKLSLMPKSVTENALSSKVTLTSGTQTLPHPHRTHHPGKVSLMPFQSAGTQVSPSPPRRPMLRSKSDLSHRYKKSGNTQLLMPGGFTLVHVDLGHGPPAPPPHCPPPPQQVPLPPPPRESGPRRGSKSSTELERFFDSLGLHTEETPKHAVPKMNPGVMRSSGSSPVFFSSVSSVDSTSRRAGSMDSGESPSGPYSCSKLIGNRTCGGCYMASGQPTTSPYLAAPNFNSGGSSLVMHPGEPSIVERNARVIKWLFNCRKAAEARKEAS